MSERNVLRKGGGLYGYFWAQESPVGATKCLAGEAWFNIPVGGIQRRGHVALCELDG